MKINPKIDHEMQFREGEVDHGASARENLKVGGRALLETILPDKALKRIASQYAHATGDYVGGNVAFGVVFGAGWGLVSGLVWDAAEALALPFAAVKDLADAAVHGVAAGFGGGKKSDPLPTEGGKQLEAVVGSGDYELSRKRLGLFSSGVGSQEAADRLAEDGTVSVTETRSFGHIELTTTTELEGAQDLADFLAIEGREADPESALARIGRALDAMEEKGNDRRLTSLAIPIDGSNTAQTIINGMDDLERFFGERGLPT
jgi:hypothetical protein